MAKTFNSLYKNSAVRDSLTGSRGSDEITEQPLGERVAEHALRVPLNAYYPVGVAIPFDGFDGAIVCTRSDAQILSRFLDGLVMRTVDAGFGAAGNCLEAAAGFKLGAVDGIVFGFRDDVLFA